MHILNLHRLSERSFLALRSVHTLLGEEQESTTTTMHVQSMIVLVPSLVGLLENLVRPLYPLGPDGLTGSLDDPPTIRDGVPALARPESDSLYHRKWLLQLLSCEL